MTEIDQTDAPLLSISDLTVEFTVGDRAVTAVAGVDLTVRRGESVAIVGQSGSGKSTLVQAILGLLPSNGRITSGRIEFEGRDLVGLSEEELAAVRGTGISLVPQDPLTNLDPLMRVGTQTMEGPIEHGLVAKRDGGPAAVTALEHAGLRNAEVNARQYPHELSGGMRQRALVAAGMACTPLLLIADEPTSALDVTVQKRLLDRLELLVSESDSAFLFITHDLALAAERAHHVIVMHHGVAVEAGPAAEVLTAPRDEYTKRLVAAAPSLTSVRFIADSRAAEPVTAPPRIELRHVSKSYRVREASGKRVNKLVLDDLSASVPAGQTLAIVGESGSGKSTTARALLRLLTPDSGEVLYDGVDVLKLRGAELRRYRTRVQPVFQDPSGSLNPRFSVFDAIAEPLVVHRVGGNADRRRRVVELLDQVGLPQTFLDRRTGALSGGQKQRVAIARALALEPETLVCDEAVSALDVLIQEQILELLARLQAELGLTYVFISHDLAVVRQIADQVVVMSEGKAVESGECLSIFEHPQSAYTRELLGAIPSRTIPLLEAP